MSEAQKKRKELIRKIMRAFMVMSAHELSIVYAFVSAYSGIKEENE